MNINAIRNQIPRSADRYQGIAGFYRGMDLVDAMSDHQWRVGQLKCSQGAELLRQPGRLERIVSARNFAEIFRITEEVRFLVDRLGPLWSYDTAQKIGFHKSTFQGDNYFPAKVYLQSGARVGAYILADNHEERLSRGDLRGRRFIDPSFFPRILAQQPSYLIENILCIGQHSGHEDWLIASN
jgi:hypothetical protein